MPALRQHRLLTLLVAAALALAVTLVLVLASSPATEDAEATGGGERGKGKRTVVMVGNNWDGTVDFVHPRTFERYRRVNVVPDLEERLNTLNPIEQAVLVGNRTFAGEGNDQLVDDIRVSPNGRTLYASRPSLNDVIALNLRTGDIKWRYSVSSIDPNHARSDHMAISPDGRQLAVSVTIGNVVDILDSRTGRRVDQVETGDFAHENEYSDDGELLYNGSIGRVITPDFEFADASKGEREFTVIDADTYDVRQVVEFNRGVRPFQVTPNGNKVYVQLSFFPGFVEYSLNRDRRLRTKHLPLRRKGRQLERSEYPLDSAHHGLALSNNGNKLCAAATISDYAAIVRRRSLNTQRITRVGRKPYWATASSDGRYCFVANSDSDDVSVLSFRSGREVERFDVGDHPQRMRMARVRAGVLRR